MLWLSNNISEVHYYWALFNIIEDKKQKQEEIQNIIEAIHSRLRPETFKSIQEIEDNTITSPEGEFDKLVEDGLQVIKIANRNSGQKRFGLFGHNVVVDLSGEVEEKRCKGKSVRG